MTAPEITHLDEATVQIRQPKASHWEAPFIFLLFGRDRALLLDSGATDDEAVFPLRGTVDGLVAKWLANHPNPGFELVVAHTHSHGDHIAGDPLFADRPHTRVVGTTLDEVRTHFGFVDWPDAVVPFDLGDRVVDVIGGPGHQESAVVFFDRTSGILFTGDTVCPGHLYVRDTAAFVATIERLISFRDAQRGAVRTLLGAHIEMSTTPGVPYPPGTVEQPDETLLAMPPSILDDVREALDLPGVHTVRDRYIIVRQ